MPVGTMVRSRQDEKNEERPGSWKTINEGEESLALMLTDDLQEHSSVICLLGYGFLHNQP